LSTTRQPRSAATGAYRLLIEPPALNNASSTSAKLSSHSSSTVSSWSPNAIVRPALRFDASSLS